MELRKAVRYALQVPTVFIWKDLNGIEQRVEGRTRDISISGAYVFARVCPPEGTSVKVDMLLATVPNSPRSLRLNAQGRVVRAERPANEGSMCGFAVLTMRALMHGGDKMLEQKVN